MFESAEIGHKIDKAVYKNEEPALREALLDAQFEMKEKGEFPVIILINGVDGAGKGETVNLLNEWMDPRLITTHAFGAPSDEESERPRMWRYWRSLPPKGHIGILFGSWYTDPIVGRVSGELRPSQLDQQIADIVHFEKMLAHEGALLLKFWFHLSKSKQEKRLKQLEKDPKTRWRVTEHDWKNFKSYDEFREISEHVLLETSTGEAPWIVVEGEDPYYRSLTVGRHVLTQIRARLDRHKTPPPPADVAPLLPSIDKLQILDTLELDQELSKSDYEEKLEALQGRLNLLTRHPDFAEMSVVAVLKATTPPARAAASAALPPPWMRAITALSRSRRLPRKSAPSPTYGAFGDMPRVRGASPSSIVPGTGACWLSGSRDSVQRPTGCGPTVKSMISRSN